MTYGIKVHCTNCDFGEDKYDDLFYTSNVVEIKKGQTVKKCLSKKPCPKCGCYTLEKNL